MEQKIIKKEEEDMLKVLLESIAGLNKETERLSSNQQKLLQVNSKLVMTCESQMQVQHNNRIIKSIPGPREPK